MTKITLLTPNPSDPNGEMIPHPLTLEGENIGEQLGDFFAKAKAIIDPEGEATEDESTPTPAAPPDGIKHRAPLDKDGVPILDSLPPTWDSNAQTWGVCQWVDIDQVYFLQTVIRCKPEGGYTADDAEEFCRNINDGHWGPPFFEQDIPEGIDWAIVAREFNTCGFTETPN